MIHIRVKMATISVVILVLSTTIMTMITIAIINLERIGVFKNDDVYFPIFPIVEAVPLDDFSFGAVGDWGCTADTIDTVRNIIDKDPEFVLALGDLSYNSSAKCWFDIIEPIADKTMITIGTHETDSPKKLKDYMDYFGLEEQYYSFNYRNIHFLSMSTELPYAEGSEQYNFVNNDLLKASSDPSVDWIVVFHHSLAYTSPADIGKGNSAEKDLRQIYHPLFANYNVDLVLQAHNHHYQRSYPIIYNNDNPKNAIVRDSDNNNYNDPEGQIFATVGTGGQSLYPFTGRAPYVASQYVGFGFLNVDLKDNGKTLNGKFYANNGTIIDQFAITK